MTGGFLQHQDVADLDLTQLSFWVAQAAQNMQ